MLSHDLPDLLDFALLHLIFYDHAARQFQAMDDDGYLLVFSALFLSAHCKAFL
jgi:hypothetical protein